MAKKHKPKLVIDLGDYEINITKAQELIKELTGERNKLRADLAAVTAERDTWKARFQDKSIAYDMASKERDRLREALDNIGKAFHGYGVGGILTEEQDAAITEGLDVLEARADPDSDPRDDHRLREVEADV